MTKLFCPYCGQPLSEGCDCERLVAEERETLLEELEERSMMYAYQQDIIDMYRRER